MLVCKSVYLLITILVFKASTVNGSNQLHIGGIFPIGGKGGWQGGQGKKDIYYCFNESVLFPFFVSTIKCIYKV